MGRSVALVISGASGMILPARLVELAMADAAVTRLHLVLTGPASKVIAHELGPERSSPRGFVEGLQLPRAARDGIEVWNDTDLTAPIASGSSPLDGVVVLPCSAGMAGSLAHGLSRGLAQRVADVALKQRWPLVIGVRESPMSPILLENLLRLAQAGAHVVPPMPAFYLRPDPAVAMATFVDHTCLRILDLLGIALQRDELRWQGTE